ncbi:MAG: MnhB domain-containing protein, partial [Actinomycetaceae bacterium]
AVFDFHLWPFGDVHLATALFFDIGVFLVVVGLVLDILRTLGAEIARRGGRGGPPAPDVPHAHPGPADDDNVLGVDVRDDVPDDPRSGRAAAVGAGPSDQTTSGSGA